MKCESCGRSNRDGAAFCDSCGRSLVRRCMRCSAELRADARFCDTCGNAVDPANEDIRARTPEHLAQKILKDRERAVGERRNVTILFADAKGYTTFSEARDEEQVYAITQSCIERMVDAVHRHEGTVNQFTGDGIMAIFGAPIAHEDAARRAVAAAVEMQEALSAHIANAGADIAFRVGLHTGPVVVGRINDNLEMDYTAIGDTVNLAARMEQIADPGHVLITGATYREVADYFDIEDLGLREVKGKADQVHVYRPLAARQIRTRMEAAVARGLSPFVGRGRDVQTLLGLWQAAQEGRGQIVMVSGEPGIGKSRLLHEFRRVVGDAAVWREAHCVSNGASTPYLPVIDLVKNGFGINEMDDADAIIGKVDADVATWSPDAQKMAPYLKFLLQIDTGDATVDHMDPMQRRAGILDALRALIFERSKAAPRIVVVEDLHWADDQSEEAFRVCADAVAASKVLMILTFRPGYVHPSSDLPNAHRIALGSLEQEAQAALAISTLHAANLPLDLADAVAAKAEGNPLFIEEVAKALAAGVADTTAVPNSLQDVILARIDRLERQARDSLQLASVIGREFSMRLLERMSDLADQLDGAVGELKALELIYEKTFFPELAYMFKHALTHDVAYSTLLLERRKVLHRVVAVSIEELYADRIAEHFETLAHHYTQAEDWPKALEYLGKAIEKAVAAYACREGLDFITRAIDIHRLHGGPDALREIVDLLRLRGQLGFGMGDLDGANSAFLEMAEIAKGLGDTSRHASALGSASMIQLYMHELEMADATAVSALGVTSDDTDARSIAIGTRALVAMFTERYAEARELLADLEAMHPFLADPWALGLVGATLIPITQEWKGNYPEALRYVDTTLDRFGENTDLFAYLFGRWVESMTLVSIGEHQQALDRLLVDTALAERTGILLMWLRALNTVGFVYSDLLDDERGMAWNQRGYDEAVAAGLPDPEIECNALLNIADIEMRLGKLDEAAARYSVVEAIYRDPKPAERFMLWRYAQHLLHSTGELRLRQGDADAALRYADECLELARQTENAKCVLKAHRLRGQVFAYRGDVDTALTELQAAVDVGREIGNAGQLWRSYSALGDVLRTAGRTDEAREAFGQARHIIDRIAAGLTDDGLRETFLSSTEVAAVQAV